MKKSYAAWNKIGIYKLLDRLLNNSITIPNIIVSIKNSSNAANDIPLAYVGSTNSIKKCADENKIFGSSHSIIWGK